MINIMLPNHSFSSPFKHELFPHAGIQNLPNYSNMAERSFDDDNSSNTSDSSTPKKRPAEASDFKLKYKTEICRYWIERGYCEYGNSCAFAHGYNEIREKSHLPNNYKTRKCKRYHVKGYCSYGYRCQFQHQKRRKEARKSRLIISYNKYMNNALTYFDENCMEFKGLCPKRSTIAIFQNIKPESEGEGEHTKDFPITATPKGQKDIQSFDEKKINRFVDQLLREDDLAESL